MWPESIVAASNIQSKSIQKWIGTLVKFIYLNSDLIFVSNYDFKPSIIEKGISIEKIKFLPNWAENIYSSNKELKPVRKDFNIPDGFVIMFAGNLGEAQDLDAVLKAAELTKENHSIQWVFIGDGRKFKLLKETVTEKN